MSEGVEKYGICDDLCIHTDSSISNSHGYIDIPFGVILMIIVSIAVHIATTTTETSSLLAPRESSSMRLADFRTLCSN